MVQDPENLSEVGLRVGGLPGRFVIGIAGGRSRPEIDAIRPQRRVIAQCDIGHLLQRRDRVAIEGADDVMNFRPPAGNRTRGDSGASSARKNQRAKPNDCGTDEDPNHGQGCDGATEEEAKRGRHERSVRTRNGENKGF